MLAETQVTTAPFPNKCLQQPPGSSQAVQNRPISPSLLSPQLQSQSYLFLTAESSDKQQQAAKASRFILLTVYILKNGSHHYGSYQKASSDLK